jgi:hypothetical protein
MAQRSNKTTMAKLNRERALRERREDKRARKDARKQEAADGGSNGFEIGPPSGFEGLPPIEEVVIEGAEEVESEVAPPPTRGR